MTGQTDDFVAALQAHLQPLFNGFMNLELWSRICIGDFDCNDEHIRIVIANQLPGFDVDYVNVDGTDFEDTWTPKCMLGLSTKKKGEEVRVDIEMTKSAITTVKLPEEGLPASLNGVDLANEFEKRQLFHTLSQESMHRQR
jgi:hypothetical protein